MLMVLPSKISELPPALPADTRFLLGLSEQRFLHLIGHARFSPDTGDLCLLKGCSQCPEGAPAAFRAAVRTRGASNEASRSCICLEITKESQSSVRNLGHAYH